MQSASGQIRYRGRSEPVLDTIRLRGRRYFVLEQLSRRGAYRVFDPHAGPAGDYRVLYRFRYSRVTKQKIEVLRRMSGPTANRSFPQIVDYVRQGSELYVVLSWVWGRSVCDLHAEVRSRKSPRPSIWQTVRLFRGLAHGVGHYHRRANLVHGDISPANLIVSAGTSQLVLIDFGSAWPAERSADKAPGDGATLPYAAPERLGGHALEDFRSDQFSLSVVAYEMLALQIPFDGAGGQAGVPPLAGHFQRRFVTPSKLAPRVNQLPRRSISLLDHLFRTTLSLHPDGRFPTRQAWLRAWDELHVALLKGQRLGPFEVRVLNSLVSFLRKLSCR